MLLENPDSVAVEVVPALLVVPELLARFSVELVRLLG